MRYVTALYLLLLSSSCTGLAGAGFEPATTCETSVAKFVNFQSPHSCACAEQLVQNALYILADQGLVPADAEIEIKNIWVYDVDNDLIEKPGRLGTYVPSWEGGPDIHLTRDMQALAHELLHYWQLEHLGVSRYDSAHHVGWDNTPKGARSSYNNASTLFRNMIIGQLYCSP